MICIEKQLNKISALSSKELFKYEYLIGEDLGYKPGVVEKVKFEYSQLGEVFNKVLKKDDKVNKAIKYNNDFIHNFNKSSVPNFNEITSIDSKLTLTSIDAVKSQTEGTNQKKITVKCIIALG